MAQSRPLSPAERSLAGQVFGDTIPLDAVSITIRPRLYGGYTPYGDINVGPGSFQADYIAPLEASRNGEEEVSDAHFFVHEMTHVWQHTVGMPVALWWLRARAEGRRVLRGTDKPRIAFYRDAATYAYEIPAGESDLLDFNMEQQCDIVADDVAHRLWGRRLDANPYNVFGHAVPSAEALAGVLARFRDDPAYPMRQGGLWQARAGFRDRGGAAG